MKKGEKEKEGRREAARIPTCVRLAFRLRFQRYYSEVRICARTWKTCNFHHFGAMGCSRQSGQVDVSVVCNRVVANIVPAQPVCLDLVTKRPIRTVVRTGSPGPTLHMHLRNTIPGDSTLFPVNQLGIDSQESM